MDPFLAEIRLLPYSFAPNGWAICAGQLMAISQNTALFSLLGTTYGGDGRTTFALPNLQGSVAMHPGQGSGLSQTYLGEQGGVAGVQLLQSEMPVHGHALQMRNVTATSGMPNGNVFGQSVYNDGAGHSGTVSTFSAQPTTTQLSPTAIGQIGSNEAHDNMQPYQVMNYCIALQGIFPQRS